MTEDVGDQAINLSAARTSKDSKPVHLGDVLEREFRELHRQTVTHEALDQEPKDGVIGRQLVDS